MFNKIIFNALYSNKNIINTLYFWTGIRNIEADAADDLPPETIPNEADFLLGYATIPGFVSYRSRSMGSWYITKLVEMLDKYANK